MNRKKRIPLYAGMALICVLTLLFLGACPVEGPIPITGISLNRTSLNLIPGGSNTLTVSYTPADTTEKGVTWGSSNNSVATVSNGTVTAVNVGTATITAISTANSSITAACTVTVSPAVVPLVGISLTPDPLTIAGTGNTDSFTVNYNPANTTETGVTWESDNTSVATVDSATGLITAVSAGSATITATSTVKSGITATANVTVTVIGLTGISLPSSHPLDRGTQGTLTVTYTPTDTTEEGVTWESDNTSVAMVDPTTGLITAVEGGTTTITATSTEHGDISDSCTVTVNVRPLTSITLSAGTLDLNKGDQQTLTITYDPEDTTEIGVTWESDNTSVATVDPTTGLITAVGGGNATITATSVRATSKTATCDVTVTVPLVGISLTPNPLTITGIGDTGSFTVEYNPTDTTETGVTWTSGNTSVATVDSTTGLITTVSTGTATITATSTVNSSKTVSATVNVGIPLTAISLPSAIFLNKGQGQTTLTVTYTPSNTTDEKAVTWTSSNDTVATVDSTTGQITAVGGGTATVTATSTANSGISASCFVIVRVPLVGISLTPNPLTITGTGYAGSFTVVYNPVDTTEKGVTWTSSNDTVATVVDLALVNGTLVNGMLTAVSGGITTITATSTVRTSLTASATVNVVIPLTDITLSATTLDLNKGQHQTLGVTYNPAITTEKGVTWSSSDPTVAEVNLTTGRITAVKAGTAIITATSTRDSSKTVSCTVTVTVPLAGISLPSALTLGEGKTYLLPVMYTPTDTTQPGVTWTTSNPLVATVGNGMITAVTTGTTTITATSTANPSISASCTVTVQPNYTGAGVAVVFEGFTDETITLDVSKGTDQITVTAPAGFDRYLWYVDATPMGSTTTHVVSQSVWNFPIGLHYLTVIVEDGNNHFSKTLAYRLGY
jgi:uncharacterized protein YjdB